MFMLASHLRKTVAEIEQMDSRELSEWVAFTTYFQPLDNSWAQTAQLITAVLTPYAKNNSLPDPKTFVPLSKRPQHPIETREQLERVRRDLFGDT